MNRIADIYSGLEGRPAKKLAVAAAADAEVLKAVAQAHHRGIVTGVLFGKEDDVRLCLAGIGENAEEYTIIHCENADEAAEKATRYVSEGKGDILMKGLMTSSDFIRAVLHKEYGLREKGARLFSTAVFELRIEGRDRLLFLADPGFIPVPDLETKKYMINCLSARMRALGYCEPKIAVLSAMETINPKILSSVEAKELEELNRRGEIRDCIVGGPFSIDLALSRRSAAHKGFVHPVAGEADAILVPSLEVGNAILKTISYLVSCGQAGFVCGTTKPVVFTSRSDSAETKMNTIALAALLS